MFPWDDLRPASALESRVAAWADALAWPTGGVLGALAWRRASVLEGGAVAARLSEPSAARVRIRRGADEAVVQVPWHVWRAVARAVLGDDDEPAAPRPPTLAERGFVAVAVADALARAAIAGTVELAADPPPWRRALLAELAVTAPVAGELVIALPATLPSPPRRPLASLCAARGERLPEVRATLCLARGRVAAWTGVRAGDVVVVGVSDPALLVARGAIAVTLDRRGAELTVRGPYQRAAVSERRRTAAAAGASVQDSASGPPTLSDDLAHDLSIPLAIVAGDVRLSARALLELAPGQVLTLGRTVGAAVEVRSGERCLARGELVTVDGELGVRILEIGDLVDPAPAVVASSP